MYAVLASWHLAISTFDSAVGGFAGVEDPGLSMHPLAEQVTSGAEQANARPYRSSTQRPVGLYACLQPLALRCKSFYFTDAGSIGGLAPS